MANTAVPTAAKMTRNIDSAGCQQSDAYIPFMQGLTDLHTHILPGMDDGADCVEQAVAMLEMEQAQGVSTVALTPHFYRSRECISDFLARRAGAYDRLVSALEEHPHPKLLLGAEVAWVPGIADWEQLEQLCYEGTQFLLVELPTRPWNEELFRQLYRLESYRGITPVIAHVERYFSCQSRRQLQSLFAVGLPMQVSAAAFSRFPGRNRCLHLLCKGSALLISDCHNTASRPPNMEQALKLIARKRGMAEAKAAGVNTRQFLLD